MFMQKKKASNTRIVKNNQNSPRNFIPAHKKLFLQFFKKYIA